MTHQSMSEIEEAVDAAKFCIGVARVKSIPDEQNAIWSVGTSEKPRITLKTLEALIQAATAYAKMQKEAFFMGGNGQAYRVMCEPVDKLTGIPPTPVLSPTSSVSAGEAKMALVELSNFTKYDESIFPPDHESRIRSYRFLDSNLHIIKKLLQERAG